MITPCPVFKHVTKYSAVLMVYLKNAGALFVGVCNLLATFVSYFFP